MKYNTTTTLNRIREEGLYADGWQKLLASLGKIEADDEPLKLLTVLDSNGLHDALWVLSYAMPDDRLARHFQAWCADQIAALRNDDLSSDEREAVRVSVWAAAWVAARATAWDAKETGQSTLWDAYDAALAAQEAQLRDMIEEQKENTI